MRRIRATHSSRLHSNAISKKTLNTFLPAINPARCTGCGWCVGVCPPHVLSLQTQQPNGWGPKQASLHDAGHCTGCALCAVRCPVDAIQMLRTGKHR